MFEFVKKQISSKRLILRNYLPDDEDAFVSWNTCPIVREHMDGAMSEEDCRLFFKQVVCNNPFAYGICFKEDLSQLVGHVFINEKTNLDFPEIGYQIDPEYWNSGLATEAAEAMIYNHLPEFGGLCASCDLANSASRNVLEKLGFLEVERFLDEEPYYAVYVLKSDS